MAVGASGSEGSYRADFLFAATFHGQPAASSLYP